jgi:hypothetical protein
MNYCSSYPPVDATQQCLDSIHLAANLSTDVSTLLSGPSSGAIPKHSSSAGVSRCVPHLHNWQAHARAVEQANRMVVSLETSLHGNFNGIGVRALRCGLSRPGDDNALRVAIPWPQDFIIRHGKKSRLC